MKTYVKETVKEVVAPLRKDIRELRGVTEQIGKAETDEGEARREDVDAVATQYVQLDKRMERVERAHDLEPVSH